MTCPGLIILFYFCLAIVLKTVATLRVAVQTLPTYHVVFWYSRLDIRVK